MRLIASAPPSSNPQLVNILPAVLTDVPENISRSTNVSTGIVGEHACKSIVSSHVSYPFFISSIGEHACWCPSQ
jgi:hypothetical protein